MATTTPNFGWAVPTSTDLVKDGAVAIETLGDSIDASLVDLKGGTTGQVLAKASGTDMDFTWTTSSAGMTNPMTTTGDTIYSSSGSTPARLGIGSTGQVLTVAAGIPSWATPSSSSTFTTDILVNNTVTVGKGNSSVASNTVVGKDAGKVITTASQTTLMGIEAGIAITSGNDNTGIGPYALTTLTTGTNNVAVGISALYATNGTENVGVGNSALSGVTSGGQNTAIGANCGYNTTTGSNNTSLGNGALPSTAGTSNSITLGNASVTVLRCQQTSITSLSDQRDKKNIEPLEVGLDFINTLKPVSFDWNMRPKLDDQGNVISTGKVDMPDVGFIAQDLIAAEDAVGLADHLQLSYRENPEALEASQGRLIPILVKAIQDLSAKVAILEATPK